MQLCPKPGEAAEPSIRRHRDGLVAQLGQQLPHLLGPRPSVACPEEPLHEQRRCGCGCERRDDGCRIRQTGTQPCNNTQPENHKTDPAPTCGPVGSVDEQPGRDHPEIDRGGECSTNPVTQAPYRVHLACKCTAMVVLNSEGQGGASHQFRHRHEAGDADHCRQQHPPHPGDVAQRELSDQTQGRREENADLAHADDRRDGPPRYRCEQVAKVRRKLARRGRPQDQIHDREQRHAPDKPDACCGDERKNQECLHEIADVRQAEAATLPTEVVANHIGRTQLAAPGDAAAAIVSHDASGAACRPKETKGDDNADGKRHREKMTNQLHRAGATFLRRIIRRPTVRHQRQLSATCSPTNATVTSADVVWSPVQKALPAGLHPIAGSADCEINIPDATHSVITNSSARSTIHRTRSRPASRPNSLLVVPSTQFQCNVM